MKSFDTYSDDDFKRSIWSALRMIAIAVAIGVPLLWWKLGWQSAVLLAVGAVISGSGLFEWLRLMGCADGADGLRRRGASACAPARTRADGLLPAPGARPGAALW